MSRATRLTQLLAATSLALLVGLATTAQADIGPNGKRQVRISTSKSNDSRNRSFDPATGRFLQRDPVLGGDPLYNPYCFPGNNPVTGSDPMGTDWITTDGNTVFWNIDETKATDLSAEGMGRIAGLSAPRTDYWRLYARSAYPAIPIGTLNARGDVVLDEPFSQTRPAARLDDLKALAEGARYIKFDRDDEGMRRFYVAGQIDRLNGGPSPALDFLAGSLKGGLQGTLDWAEGTENAIIKLARIPAYPLRKFGGAVVCFSGHYFFNSPKMESLGITLVENTIPEHKWSPDLVGNPEWSRTVSKVGGGEATVFLATLGAGTAFRALGAAGEGVETGRGYVSGCGTILEKLRKIERLEAMETPQAAAEALSLRGELQAAKFLRSEGQNVHFLQEGAKRTPDFLVGGQRGTGLGGIPFEVKTPWSNSPANVFSRILSGNPQGAQGVFLNLRYSTVKTANLGPDLVKTVQSSGAPRIESVIILE